MNKQVRSLTFLPEVFKTSTNEQFLSASLDLLTTQPQFNRVEGFVGQQYGYATEATDRYVVEPTKNRNNYQLSPAVVFLKDNTQKARDVIDYPGIVSALKNLGAAVDDPNKLFGSEFYSWDSFCDLDKIVNYSQYYWLPLGPDAVEVTSSTTIDISTIIGAINYTSENDVVFVNGLKVIFIGNTLPAEYENREYYVGGVGDSINLIPVEELKVVENTGVGIYDPWSGTAWDSTGWSVDLYVPVDPDYIVIDRNSRDRNAWSRGNRWFSQSVVDETVKHNGNLTTITTNTVTRARRPIIEFRGNLSLWNSGTSSVGIVDFIDTSTLDPLSTITGQSTCTLDNGTVSVQPGSSVVFAAATDITVRQSVYTVTAVSAGPAGEIVINLSPLITTVIDDSQIYISKGPGNQTGSAWRWSDVDSEWTQSQLKTGVNQSPLFDIFNENSISLGNQSFYPASDFEGTKLFSYAPADGINDPVLGIPISYSSVSNLGDINFEVNLNSDTFTYTQSGKQVTKNISEGFVHYSSIFGSVTKQNGWVKSAGNSFQYQVFSFIIDEANQIVVTCDILAAADSPWTTTQVFFNGNYQGPDSYSVVTDATDNTTTIFFNSLPALDSKVDVLLISDQVSKTAYYTVPANLQNNPFNTNITTVTVGDIRNHYKTIFQNAPGISGTEFGINNYSNLGNLVQYGSAIIQNSSSLVLPAVFLRKPGYSIGNAIKYSSDEYIDYKNTIIDIANNDEYSVYQSPDQILDSIIYKITAAKNQDDSFFWSDMIVSGSPVKVSSYDFLADVAFAICPLIRVYDFTSANYYGVTVYLERSVNNKVTYTQLIRGVHYTVDSTAPSLRVDYQILTGDRIVVKEYNQTYGSYVPQTPTSMGLYPATIPKIVTDSTYFNPTQFIVGHDGSYTRLYGEYLPLDSTDLSLGSYLTDFRDIALLEFECRVYNNIKVSGKIPLMYSDLFPGQFRKTSYTREEILPAYSENFMTWVGKNRVDYRTQIYNSGNQYSFNYNQSSNKLDGSKINQGYWRGIYRWFYDTTNPDTAPWEMLGLTDQPTWWTARYGVTPYTSGNTLMWTEIANGFIWNNGDSYTDSRYARPELLSVLPVDDSGNLVSPMISVIGNYNSQTFNRSWTTGDEGPTESSYLRSSTWPFDLMKLMSTFLPAKFYNLFADRDRYAYDADTNQYLFNTSYHLRVDELEVYGSGTSKNSYINWVVDYINQSGTDGHSDIIKTFKNLDVRLTYRLSGFSDKQYLKFLIERSTPTSNTPRLLIPDDSFQVMLYDDVPAEKINYSSVIVQKTSRGWTVFGNSVTSPYFDIAVATPGPLERITVGTVSVQISTTYKKNTSMLVAYGTEFFSLQGVSEFLVNYGRRLADQGIQSDNIVEGTVIDWKQMIKEFVNWGQQGWEIGTTLSLNPNARLLTVQRDGLVVQPMILSQNNFVLNQNLIPLTTEELSVVRSSETFTLNVLSVGDTVAYTNLNLSSIEHIVVFDNVTIFNDIIYQLPTGLKQNRIVMTGSKTADWNGNINAHGFILNEGDVDDWQSDRKYAVGEIVIHKARYWSAKQLVEPAVEFDSSQWTEVNYDKVKVGLLPNPSTMSSEALKFYDITSANLERDKDLLAFGLIGFRPRQYMVDAELSDISQINIYSNMIKSKGTNSISETFKGANLVQGAIDYDVRENWALKDGDFGSVLNSNFVELMLSQRDLTGNPALIGFTDGTTVNTATQQSVNIDDLINYGRAPTVSTFLPKYDTKCSDIRQLPTAGYANLDDVKFAVYILDDLNLNRDTVSKLYTTDSVWVANYQGTWAILSPMSLGTTVETIINNLNNTVDAVFTDQHGLVLGDPVIITGFDTRVDGAFEVLAVVDNYTVTIGLALDKAKASLEGTGIALGLVNRRVAQASDCVTVAGTQFQTRLNWVDSDKNGDWQVLAAGPVYKQATVSSGNGFGGSVAYMAGVGSLTVDVDGKLFVDGVDQAIIVGTTIVVAGNVVCGTDGTSITVHSYSANTWTVVQTAIATVAHSLAISGNGRWLYAADVTTSTVDVYLKVAGVYVMIDALAGPTSEQWGKSIATTHDGSKLIVGAPGKTVSAFTNAGGAYIYSRANESFQADGTSVSYTLSNSAGANAIVTVNSIEVAATISGTTVTFTTAPVAGSVISVEYGRMTLQRSLLSDSLHDGALFGNSVTTRGYGEEIFIGAPYEFNYDTQVEGAVYRFTNSGQRWGTVTGTVSTTASGTIFIDGYRVDYSGTASDIADQINASEPTNVSASAVGTQLTITTFEGTSNTPGDIVDIVGNTEADLTALGITVYKRTQIIYSAQGGTNTAFGFTVAMNSELGQRDSLIISATTAKALSATTFDFIDNIDTDDDTIFDNGATSFIDGFGNIGVVYQYDYLASNSESSNNPGNYVFGQYCQYVDITGANTNARWGSSLAFSDGTIVVGTNHWSTNTGITVSFTTTTEVSSWYVDKQPIDQVDVNRLKNISIYDTSTNIDLEHLDYINPAQGKLSAVIETNIDFISGYDPASYSLGLVWGMTQVGKTWLDTTNLRMLDTTQPDINYNARYWGAAFPGSRASIYTWVSSSVPPENYSGAGFVVDLNAYTSGQVYNYSTDSMTTEYYFWVKDSSEVAPGKTLSATVLAQYVINPIASGVPFLAAITTDVVALYNCADSIQSRSSALHLGYSVGSNGDNAHQSWKLIQAGTAGQFLSGVPASIADMPTGMYLKYLNSFMGSDLTGAPVPDPALPELIKSGLQFRPRQTMFIDRVEALQNYIEYANSILIKYAITETRGTYFLKSGDSTYDTTDFWTTVDWWQEGYSASTKIVIEVETYTDLLTVGLNPTYSNEGDIVMSLQPGLVARVAKNGQGNSETYIWYQTTGWTRIGLTNGTIQILDTLYTSTTVPALEIYSIIRWLTEQVFINDLEIENNRSLILMFKLIQSQSPQQNNYLTWLNKTSLVDVTHLVRTLAPYKKYQRDNQELVRDYLNEIKPYHVHIKEFGLKYVKTDYFNGMITDFDLPAQYNADNVQFVSPRLVNSSPAPVGEYLPTSTIWAEQEYTNWFNNYGLSFSNSESERVPVTTLVTINTSTALAKAVAVGDPQISLVTVAGMPGAGTVVINGHQIAYTAANYYSNKLTLAAPARFAHVVGTTVTGVATVITASNREIHLKNTDGLPDSGNIVIDNEIISYTFNDRSRDTLTGVTRGAEGTVAQSHLDGATVSLITETIVVLSGGRGYVTRPTITAAIDTTVYPVPRTEATFTAVLSGDRVSRVTVTNAGSGYAVLPTLTVEPSPITSTWTAADVDLVTNQITITGHQFVTGDSVVFTGSTATAFGLKDNEYYYVGRIDADTVAFYTDSRDAALGWTNSFRQDTTRVKLNVQGDGTVAVTARVEVYTNSRPVREMKIGLKFDRTSYYYHDDDKNAIYRIQNSYKPTVNMPGFDLNDYDQLMSGTKYPNMIILDPAFDYGKTLTFAAVDIDTALNTIQVNLIVGVPGIVYDTGLIADGVYEAIFVVTTGALNANFGLTSGNTYYLRALTSGTGALVAVYATENAAVIDVGRIALNTALTVGQFVITSDPATGNHGYDSILINDNTVTSTAYDFTAGQFAQGYGPEEMVPSVLTGTVNMTVTTKPGSTWVPTTPAVTETLSTELAATGFTMNRATLTPVGGMIDFKSVLPNPASLALYANGKLFDPLALDGSSRHLPPDYYQVDWFNKTITLIDGPMIVNGSLTTTDIDVVVYEWGNGNQIIRSNSEVMPLRTVGGHSEIVLDVPYDYLLSALPTATNFELTSQVVVNGNFLSYGIDYTIEPVRTLDVNDPFNPAKIVFTSLYSDAVDWVTFVVTADGSTTIGGVTTLVPAVGVSIPRTEWFTGLAGSGVVIPLTNFTGDTNAQNMIVEVNGMRIDGAAPTEVAYTALVGVSSYAAPVYGMASFDITKMVVTVNGVSIPASAATWQANYDTLTQQPARFDAEFDLLFGYFNGGTPFDNWTALDTVFAPGYLTPGDAITISYDADGAPNPVFLATPDVSSIGGTVTVNLILNPSDIVSVTTFDRTTDQSLVTQAIDDLTVSLITAIVEDGVTPVTITTRLKHNLETGDLIMINGTAAPDLDGNRYWVNTVSTTVFELYSDAFLTVPVIISNTGPLLPAKSSFVQLLDASQIPPTIDQNLLLINQPDYTLYDKDRLIVSHIKGIATDIRGYVDSDRLMIVDNTLIVLEEVEPTDTIVITSMVPGASPDQIKFRMTTNSASTVARSKMSLTVVNSVISNVTGATAVKHVTLLDITSDRIVALQVFDGTTEITDYLITADSTQVSPSTAIVLPASITATSLSVLVQVRSAPEIYRENQFTRTYLSATTVTTPGAQYTDVLTVHDPLKLVTVYQLTGIQVLNGLINGLPANYCDITVPDASLITSITSSVTDFTVLSQSISTSRLVFTSTPAGTVLDFTVAVGNCLIIQSEQIIFDSIDLVTGTVTGLKRGSNGTIVNAQLDQYSTVQTVLSENRLPISYNAIDWYERFTGLDRGFPTTTMPLQSSVSDPAQFLNTLVRV